MARCSVALLFRCNDIARCSVGSTTFIWGNMVQDTCGGNMADSWGGLVKVGQMRAISYASTTKEECGMQKRGREETAAEAKMKTEIANHREEPHKCNDEQNIVVRYARWS